MSNLSNSSHLGCKTFSESAAPSLHDEGAQQRHAKSRKRQAIDGYQRRNDGKNRRERSSVSERGGRRESRGDESHRREEESHLSAGRSTKVKEVTWWDNFCCFTSSDVTSPTLEHSREDLSAITEHRAQYPSLACTDEKSRNRETAHRRRKSHPRGVTCSEEKNYRCRNSDHGHRKGSAGRTFPRYHGLHDSSDEDDEPTTNRYARPSRRKTTSKRHTVAVSPQTLRTLGEAVRARSTQGEQAIDKTSRSGQQNIDRGSQLKEYKNKSFLRWASRKDNRSSRSGIYVLKTPTEYSNLSHEELEYISLCVEAEHALSRPLPLSSNRSVYKYWLETYGIALTGLLLPDSSDIETSDEEEEKDLHPVTQKVSKVTLVARTQQSDESKPSNKSKNPPQADECKPPEKQIGDAENPQIIGNVKGGETNKQRELAEKSVIGQDSKLQHITMRLPVENVSKVSISTDHKYRNNVGEEDRIPTTHIGEASSTLKAATEFMDHAFDNMSKMHDLITKQPPPCECTSYTNIHCSRCCGKGIEEVGGPVHQKTETVQTEHEHKPTKRCVSVKVQANIKKLAVNKETIFPSSDSESSICESESVHSPSPPTSPKSQKKSSRRRKVVMPIKEKDITGDESRGVARQKLQSEELEMTKPTTGATVTESKTTAIRQEPQDGSDKNSKDTTASSIGSYAVNPGIAATEGMKQAATVLQVTSRNVLPEATKGIFGLTCIAPSDDEMDLPEESLAQECEPKVVPRIIKEDEIEKPKRLIDTFAPPVLTRPGYLGSGFDSLNTTTGSQEERPPRQDDVFASKSSARGCLTPIETPEKPSPPNSGSSVAQTTVGSKPLGSVFAQDAFDKAHPPATSERQEHVTAALTVGVLPLRQSTLAPLGSVIDENAFGKAHPPAQDDHPLFSGTLDISKKPAQLRPMTDVNREGTSRGHIGKLLGSIPDANAFDFAHPQQSHPLFSGKLGTSKKPTQLQPMRDVTPEETPKKTKNKKKKKDKKNNKKNKQQLETFEAPQARSFANLIPHNVPEPIPNRLYQEEMGLTGQQQRRQIDILRGAASLLDSPERAHDVPYQVSIDPTEQHRQRRMDILERTANLLKGHAGRRQSQDEGTQRLGPLSIGGTSRATAPKSTPDKIGPQVDLSPVVVPMTGLRRGRKEIAHIRREQMDDDVPYQVYQRPTNPLARQPAVGGPLHQYHRQERPAMRHIMDESLYYEEGDERCPSEDEFVRERQQEMTPQEAGPPQYILHGQQHQMDPRFHQRVMEEKHAPFYEDPELVLPSDEELATMGEFPHRRGESWDDDFQ